MILDLIKHFDKYLCAIEDSILNGRGILLSFCFHKVFKTRSEITTRQYDPQQKNTLEDYRIFIEYFLSHGFRFILPDDLKTSLAKKNIILTFDDGYFNNSFILPVLEQFKIPALFFITTGNMINNECFWWDILYRKNPGKYNQIKRQFKKSKVIDIRNSLISGYGRNVFQPTCDYDRPFSETELRDFSRSKYVVIGNHTHSHENLINCNENDVYNDVLLSQQIIEKVTGKPADYMAYPYGFKGRNTIAHLSSFNFKNVFSIKRRPNKINSENKVYEINRYFGPHGPIDTKLLKSYQVPFSLYYALAEVYSNLEMKK